MSIRDLFTEERTGYDRTSEGSVRYTFRELRDWVWGVVLAALAVAALYGLGFSIAGYESFSCHRELTNRGLDGHFDVWGEGCYVHLDDGRVLPLSDVKPKQIEIDTREGADG